MSIGHVESLLLSVCSLLVVTFCGYVSTKQRLHSDAVIVILSRSDSASIAQMWQSDYTAFML
jgi:hypothetical protein